MKRLLPGIVALCAALGFVPALAGQVIGLPVYNSGIPTGLGIYADIGFPNDAAGGGTTLGATGRLGLGPFGATASVARFNPEGPADALTSVGATLNYKVFGGPLVPLTVTLQGGAGYATQDDFSFYRFPVGLGLALTIPNPVLAIKPWLAPRVDVRRVSGPSFFIPSGIGGFPTPSATGSDTDVDFGLSGGVELNLLSGLGLHASYDRIFADVEDASIFAAGLHYTFRVPGL